jgi:hypothetical protein
MYDVNDSGEILRNKKKNSLLPWIYVLLIMFLVVSIIAFVQFQDKEKYTNLYYRSKSENNTLLDKLNNIESTTKNINEKYNGLEIEFNKTKDIMKSITNQLPVIMKSIDFKSGKYPNSFKTRFLQNDITYLYPRIKFTNLTTKDKLVLYVKYYSPDAILATHPKSPYGYTQKVEITMNKSDNSYILTGFGNKNGGTYKVGKNKCQIWHNDRILFEKELNVY